MYNKYIMDYAETARLQNSINKDVIIDELIKQCEKNPNYKNIEDKIKFKNFVKNEYNLKKIEDDLDVAILIDKYLGKIRGGRRSKQSKKRSATRRRRSFKRKSRKMNKRRKH